MRALLCEAFGPPESLEIKEIDAPEPKPHQLVVRVESASVNFPDALIVQGLYQIKPPFPFSPGNDLAGEVTKVGAEVEGFSVGDRVVSTVFYGAFQERVAVDARAAFKIPDGIEGQTAAAMLLTYSTSLYALQDRAQLAHGETLVVLGAAGGVGLSAVQIGKAMGAQVIACASSAEKLELCKASGADELVNYEEEDLKSKLKSLTGGAGADVVYDPVGGRFAEPTLRATGWGGRYVVIGFAAGDIPKIPLNLVLLKGCAVVGALWGGMVMRTPELYRKNVETLFAMLGQGAIEPHIGQVFPFDEAAAAIRCVQDRKARGKVMVKF